VHAVRKNSSLQILRARKEAGRGRKWRSIDLEKKMRELKGNRRGKESDRLMLGIIFCRYFAS
jgi:hypothetical protein